VKRRLVFTGALSKCWEDPASVENVITTPCDAAIQGAAIGLVANPNLVYSEYCGMAEELERVVVRQIANLVGYDPQQATGVFTQGGTFCNLYEYLFGIRKALPQSKNLGLEYGQDYRMINSQGGHYSNTTNLSLLGVNISRKTICIKLTQASNMDLKDLVEGQSHLQSTIECSRGAAGLFGAYSALNSLGKQGYQILIAHGLQNADYLLDRLAKSPGAVVVAAENCGPSVGFRLYDPVRVSDPIAELLIEKTSTNASENQQRLADNTSYHRRIFLNRGKVGLYTNWIQYVTHSD